MAPFRERGEHELVQLPSEELVGYLRAARAAGRHDAVRLALAILVFGYHDRVRWRVERKVAEHEVDEVVGDVLESAVGAIFAGDSVGEFTSWLWTITDRRIVDHYRRLERQPAKVSVDRGSSDEENRVAEPGWPGDHSVVEMHDAIERVLSGMRGSHREIAVRYAILREDGHAVAHACNTTRDNVHQIGKRFRDALRAELGEVG
jgi:DNA-directed RNA polymerase specialized sigma24 family protein